jgi:hypothetical protein
MHNVTYLFVCNPLDIGDLAGYPAVRGLPVIKYSVTTNRKWENFESYENVGNKFFFWIRCVPHFVGFVDIADGKLGVCTYVCVFLLPGNF